MPKGKEHVPILEMADGKITHTLHLVFHSVNAAKKIGLEQNNEIGALQFMRPYSPILALERPLKNFPLNPGRSA